MSERAEVKARLGFGLWREPRGPISGAYAPTWAHEVEQLGHSPFDEMGLLGFRSDNVKLAYRVERIL